MPLLPRASRSRSCVGPRGHPWSSWKLSDLPKQLVSRPSSQEPPIADEPPKWPQAQDAQRLFNDISHGVRFLSAYEPRRSLCRFASPTPSALGVSHSLSDFSRPGLVALFRATSTHRISAFRAFSSRPAVTPLDALCSLAVSVGVSLPTTSERCSDREFVLGTSAVKRKLEPLLS
jgi:hypothetical protein